MSKTKLISTSFSFLDDQDSTFSVEDSYECKSSYQKDHSLGSTHFSVVSKKTELEFYGHKESGHGGKTLPAKEFKSIYEKADEGSDYCTDDESECG